MARLQQQVAHPLEVALHRRRYELLAAPQPAFVQPHPGRAARPLGAAAAEQQLGRAEATRQRRHGARRTRPAPGVRLRQNRHTQVPQPLQAPPAARLPGPADGRLRAPAAPVRSAGDCSGSTESKASWKAGAPAGLHQGPVVGGLRRPCQSALAPPEAVCEQRLELCGRPLLSEAHVHASERLLLRSICHLGCSCPSTNGAPGQRQHREPAGFTLCMPALCMREY